MPFGKENASPREIAFPAVNIIFFQQYVMLSFHSKT